MKKMMIFAVMMSMLLMPAQMMAKNNNRDFAKPRVENRVRKNEKKGAKMKFDNARHGKPGKHKFNKREKERRPMPPVARRHRRPMPRPLPPPPPPRYHHHHHHHCDNGAAETAATIIGLAALISAIAD
ncbi:MAG: hypothetical protein IIU97_00760 [Bacteroidaceae bacterium]|nr:hypothetical protein [Bacteroidaceae bacterium]